MAASPASVGFARVLRVPADTHRTAKGADAALTVELGAARILVPSGFDRGTFAAVVDVLGARGGTR